MDALVAESSQFFVRPLDSTFIRRPNPAMNALVNYAPEPHSVELRDLPKPEIGEEDVLLAVEAVGVCGSDLHQYTGKQSWKVNYPVVLGHEFGGVIAMT